MPDILTLHSAIAAKCPIHGVSVGSWADKATWRIDFDPAATTAQQQAAQNIVAAFDATAPSFANKIAAGCQVTSPTRPYLNGTYAIDDVMQARVDSIAAGINAAKGFPHGNAAYNWPVATGQVTFKTTQDAIDVFAALRDYVSDLILAESALATGNTAAWPTQPTAIA